MSMVLEGVAASARFPQGYKHFSDDEHVKAGARTTLLLSIMSIAWLCNTVGLFLANNSVVNAYAKRANSVPPKRMTCRYGSRQSA